MKSLISLLVAITFVGVGVFGFAIGSHSANHEKPNCFISSIVGNAPCPENLVASLNYHSSVIEKFSNSLLPFIFSLLAFLAGISASFLVLHYQPPKLKCFKFFSQRRHELLSDLSISKKNTLRWLSLFELSPSV